MRIRSISTITLFLMLALPLVAQTTAFTYQGRLTNAGAPANGTQTVTFKLYDAETGGTQIASVTKSVNVTNGIFTTDLDFGAAAFDGNSRYLELTIGSTILLPRQHVTSSPYAVRARDATNLSGFPSSGFIQNTQTQQTGANFNIDGNGTVGGTLSANILAAQAQYNIGGFPVFSIPGPGSQNIFVGQNSGASTPAGSGNSAFGAGAAQSVSSGNNNSFFGAFAGRFTNSDFNSFFGWGAGQNTTSGGGNSFFGHQAGSGNSTGANNTLLGTGADVSAGNLVNATAVGARAAVSQSNSLVLGSINGVNGATADTRVGIGTTAPTHRLDVAGTVNTSTQFNIGGQRVLFAVASGVENLFVGIGAGPTNTGTYNTFVGANAGFSHTSGQSNAFFGREAGFYNTVGTANTFIGYRAGWTSAGHQNTFIGNKAGQLNTTGVLNTFVGFEAGTSNGTGSNNTIVGTFADVGSADLTNATAIGHRAVVAQRDSLVLGSINGVNGATADTKVGIGTTTPSHSLDVAGIINTSTQYNIGGLPVVSVGGGGEDNTFVGFGAGQSNIFPGESNSFFGNRAGQINTTGSRNSFFGQDAGHSNITGDSNTLIGAFADVGSPGLVNATAIGATSFVTQSNSLVLGGINGVNQGVATFVGIGTTAPSYRLEVFDPSNRGLRVQTNTAGGKVASFGGSGIFEIDRPGVAGGRVTVLENGNVGIGYVSPSYKLDVNGEIRGTNVIPSDGRFKKNVSALTSPLLTVLRLRGVSYSFRSSEFPEMNFMSGRRFGFIAQEVERVFPELISRDDKGYLSLAYSELLPVVVEAVKEQQVKIDQLRSIIREQERKGARQQAQIEEQKRQLRDQELRDRAQQRQIDLLQALLCKQNAGAELCKDR